MVRVRYGAVWFGTVGHGVAVKARSGGARCDTAWRGKAVKVRQGPSGPVELRCGGARRLSSGEFGFGLVWRFR